MRPPLRILFVAGSQPPMVCGVGDYTATLAAEISRRGEVTVGVLTSELAAKGQVAGVQLLPIAKGWRFSEIFKVIGAIRSWDPDIVHLQYPTLGYGNSWMPYFLPLLLRLYSITVVQTWHEPPTRFRFFPNALTRDVLIGVEPDYLQRIRKRYSGLVRRKTTRFIPVGSSIPRAELSDPERAVIREQYAGPSRNLVAFFGFVYPTKRVEALFEIADPGRDTIVLVTHLDEQNDSYHKKIVDCIRAWPGKVIVTGRLNAQDVARVLCAADAAVFPFQNGLGMRNTSFLAARSQGTFTITTSLDKQGYDAGSNVFYACQGDNEAMGQALSQNMGRRAENAYRESFDWSHIAEEHISVYRDLIPGAKDCE